MIYLGEEGNINKYIDEFKGIIGNYSDVTLTNYLDLSRGERKDRYPDLHEAVVEFANQNKELLKYELLIRITRLSSTIDLTKGELRDALEEIESLKAENTRLKDKNNKLNKFSARIGQGKSFKRFSLKDRRLIQSLLKENKSTNQIAIALNVNWKTIDNYINNNGGIESLIKEDLSESKSVDLVGVN